MRAGAIPPTFIFYTQTARADGGGTLRSTLPMAKMLGGCARGAGVVRHVD